MATFRLEVSLGGQYGMRGGVDALAEVLRKVVKQLEDREHEFADGDGINITAFGSPIRDENHLSVGEWRIEE